MQAQLSGDGPYVKKKHHNSDIMYVYVNKMKIMPDSKH